RLDDDRHGIGRLDHFAYVDVVQLQELQAVDRDQVGDHAELLGQDAAQRAADVLLESDDEREAGSDRAGHRPDEARGQGVQRAVARLAPPGEGDRDRLLTLLEVEAAERLADGRLYLLLVAQLGRQARVDDRQIPQRQDGRVRDVDRVPAELDRELRGADHRGPDALADRQQIGRQAAPPAGLVQGGGQV